MIGACSALIHMNVPDSPVLDNAVLADISPKSVPGWIRFTVANRLADSGAEWASTMERENSGSYTNQVI